MARNTSDTKDLTDRIVDYSNRISILLMEKADLVQENKRLRTRLEEVALLADVCISHDLGRPCPYCECGGKNTA